MLRTVYAELLDRTASAYLRDSFAQQGTFVAKTVRGRRYWYFQEAAEYGRGQRYVGPETPDLLAHIAHHKLARDHQHDLRSLVSTLVRSASLPRPLPAIGDVVAALASAGVFRLRGVLVGTLAFQTYSAMLGERLPVALMQTGDVDVAQFAEFSTSVDDQSTPIIDALKRADSSFRPLAHRRGRRQVTAFKATGGPRVSFLTPTRGPETDRPRHLPAFGIDAQPMRFLDFLIHDPQPAVLLHGIGVHVLVPAPERFALHKLIGARGRMADTAGLEMDIRQAGALLGVLIRRRPDELRAAWQEAYARGVVWRRLLGEGLGLMHPGIRERTLKHVGMTRSIIPGLDLQFEAPAAGYDGDGEAICFFGKSGAEAVRCVVSRTVLDDHFGTGGCDARGRLAVFREHRPRFERLARAKYLRGPIEEPGSVLIGPQDVAAPGQAPPACQPQQQG